MRGPTKSPGLTLWMRGGVGYTPPPMAKAASSARDRRAARGRELLTDPGGLWSALPVEWPREAGGSEAALPGWPWRVRETLVALLVRPWRSFVYVQEPIDHAAAIRFLLSVRLPLWGVLLAVLLTRALQGPAMAITVRPIHGLLDPRLTDALALWSLLMTPAGVPLLYFFLGITAHVAVALTGGAPRSIAASMRAVGYAIAPALLGVALLDLPLHLGLVPSLAYAGALAGLTLLVFVLAGSALTATHQIAAARGFVVALVPAALFAGAQVLRAALVLRDLPGWAPPQGMPYFVP